jgi:hypothetical protein
MGEYKPTYVTKKEFNRHLAWASTETRLLYVEKPLSIGQRKGSLVSWLWTDRDSTTAVLLTDGVRYVYEKENDELSPSDLKEKNRWSISGSDAYKIGQRQCHIPDLSKDERYANLIVQLGESRRFAFGECQLLYGNPEYDNKGYQEAYGYDRNSAYPASMMQPMPDTKNPLDGERNVRKGEIGFNLLDGHLRMVHKGEFAMWIFPAMESPFTKFATNFYEKKRNAKNKWEKSYYKALLNYYIGFFQRTNPFIRAAILGYSADYMLSKIDEDTLACNTDSIVSKRPRPDLEIGLGLGQFKYEHHGLFAYIGAAAMVSQWKNDELGNDKVCAPGVSKARRAEGYDIMNPVKIEPVGFELDWHGKKMILR